MRRVAVHLPRQQLSADLVLPAGCPVALLLPALVDGVLGDGPHTIDPARWYLAPAVGLPLDPSKSLLDNGIRDGDLVLLTDEPVPPPRVRTGSPTDGIIAAGHKPPPRSDGWAAGVAASVFLTLAAALGWTGYASGQQAALWVSAAIAMASAVAAIAGWVTGPFADALSVGAVGHAAVTGALAAAGFSGAVVVAFAAAAALAMALSLSMTGCAAAGGAVLLAATIGALTTLDTGAIGAVLTGVSLAGLAGAGSLAASMAGIGPSRRTIGTRRAQAAHRLLTDLTAGWCGTAVVGVVAIAVSDEHRVTTAVFAALIGVVLILRHRVHAKAVRRRILIGAGLATSAIALSVAVIASPSTAPWTCGTVAAAGATLVRLRGVAWNPLLHSMIRGVEYAATAAVVPLGAWLTGVYDAARAASLT